MSFPLIIGITTAIVHVVSGPDHLAAVAPLVFETKKKHWKIGFLWGIGHILGMLTIGVLFYLFKDFIPINTVSYYSEQLTGVILIGLGIWIFYRIRHEKSNHKHFHLHNEKEKGNYIHTHKHEHKEKEHVHNYSKRGIKKNNFTATFIGIIHGFAGISHFLLMLPVLGYESKIESLQYIIGFGAGTIFAMIVFTVITGRLHKIQSDKNSKYLLLNLRFLGALAAITVGVFWIINSL